MNYLKKNPNDSIVYPFILQQLRTDNPTTSFPENLDAIAAEWNCFQVTSTEQPAYNPITHTLTEGTPILDGGVYYQSWQVVPYTLEQSKINKLAAIESERMQLESQGWNSGQGFSLGTSPSDIALFAGVFALAKEAAALGLPLPKLITLDDQTITFATIQEMTTLLLRYGAARAELSETFAARRKAVESATTLEELNALP